MTRKVETLARIPLFCSLTDLEVQRLDTQCVWRRAREKEYIVNYQDEGADLYFVVQGRVRVLIQAVSGKESILRDIKDGEFFGELAAIDGRPRSAAILSLTDAVIAKMPPGVFRNVVHMHPDVCDRVLVLLASQVRMLANRVNEFTTMNVRSRIYTELLRLAKPVKDAGSQAAISPPPTHAELAARVSTHREAVTRELNSLKRAGLLHSRPGAIILLDPAKIARLISEVE